MLKVSTLLDQQKEAAEAMPSYKPGRRLYLTADKERAVDEGSPEAAYLLVSAEGELSMEEAAKYGLLPSEESIEPTVEPPLDSAIAEAEAATDESAVAEA